MYASAVRSGRALRLVVTGLILLTSTGCAGLFSYGTTPSGLSHQDDALRRALVRGEAAEAIDLEDHALPDDELLRALYIGTLAHYAGEYASSDSALERAAELAEDRYTKRVSRAALSVVTSDRALPFEPVRTERLLIHYYGALNRLRSDDLSGAVVEARRLVFLLREGRDDASRAGTVPTFAFLHYFAGLIFEAAGDRNDADVAFRNAAALGGQPRSEPPIEPLPDTLGEVIVLFEEGFVAHRIEQSLVVPLHPFEVDRLVDGEGRAGAAASVATRVVAHAVAKSHDVVIYGRRSPRALYVDPPSDRYYREVCEQEKQKENGRKGRKDRDCSGSGRTPYILRLAWPIYRAERVGTRSDWSVAAANHTEASYLTGDVSAAVIDDFSAERTRILTRMVARSAAKLALTAGIERSVSEHDSDIGRILGVLTNLGTAILEQADTRSWQLLPQRIGVARLRLPPGTHRLTVRHQGSDGGALLDLGDVELGAGETVFVPHRVWR